MAYWGYTYILHSLLHYIRVHSVEYVFLAMHDECDALHVAQVWNHEAYGGR